MALYKFRTIIIIIINTKLVIAVYSPSNIGNSYFITSFICDGRHLKIVQ